MKYLTISTACLSIMVLLGAMAASCTPVGSHKATIPNDEASNLRRLQSQAVGFMTGSEGNPVPICSVTHAYMEHFLSNKKNGVTLEQAQSRILFLFSQASSNLNEGEKRLFINLISNTASATYESKFLNVSNLELANRMYCASVKKDLMRLAAEGSSDRG